MIANEGEWVGVRRCVRRRRGAGSGTAAFSCMRGQGGGRLARGSVLAEGRLRWAIGAEEGVGGRPHPIVPVSMSAGDRVFHMRHSCCRAWHHVCTCRGGRRG